MKEMLGGCCVCSDERGWTENPLVYCDGQGCTVAVHQGSFSQSPESLLRLSTTLRVGLSSVKKIYARVLYFFLFFYFLKTADCCTTVGGVFEVDGFEVRLVLARGSFVVVARVRSMNGVAIVVFHFFVYLVEITF